MTATFGLGAYGIGFGVSLWRRAPRPVLVWTSIPLLLTAATFGLAGRFPFLHEAFSLLIVSIGMRNMLRYPGVVRICSAVGAAGWFVAIVCASVLFGH